MSGFGFSLYVAKTYSKVSQFIAGLSSCCARIVLGKSSAAKRNAVCRSANLMIVIL